MNQRKRINSIVSRGIFYASRTLVAPGRESRTKMNRLRRIKHTGQTSLTTQQQPAQPPVELSQSTVNRLLHTPLKDLTEQEIQSARDLWRTHSHVRQSFYNGLKKHTER